MLGAIVDAREVAVRDQGTGFGAVGFVGTGEIARAMVEGIVGVPGHDGRVVVSPRSAAVSSELAERFEPVTVAPGNQQVVNESEIVVLAVRPDQLDSLRGLTFRDDQLVVSVLAGVSIEAIRGVVGSTVPVVRAVPLPPVSRRRGVTLLVPSHPTAVALFDALGGTTILADEDQMPALVTITGAASAFFQYVASLSAWAAERGVPAAEAETFTRAMIASLAPSLTEDPGDMSALLRGCETPGGLNEQLRRDFWDEATVAHLNDGLDGVMHRLTD